MSLPEPFLTIIALAFIFLSLVVIVLAIVTFYNLFNRWLQFFQKEQTKEKEEVINDAYTQAFKIIEDAKKEAIQTIKTANIKEQDSLLHTKKFTEVERENWNKTLESSLSNFQQRMDQATADITNYYQSIIAEHKNRNITALKKVSQHLEDELLDEAKQFESFLEEETDDFKHSMERKTLEAENEAERKVEEKYQQVEAELETYKQERLKEINNSVMHILHAVSENILGKSLSVEEHQDLIYQALEEAIHNEELPKTHAE